MSLSGKGTVPNQINGKKKLDLETAGYRLPKKKNHSIEKKHQMSKNTGPGKTIYDLEDQSQIKATAAKLVKKLQKKELRMSPQKRRQWLKKTTRQRAEEINRVEVTQADEEKKLAKVADDDP